jgi:hypothetical protein
MTANYWKSLAAYVLPTFPLAYSWHMTAFAQHYSALEMLRPDPIIPFGLITMLIQGAIFSWAYPQLFDRTRERWLASGLKAGAVFGLIAWSFAVLAVAAKYRSASTGDFIVLESAFTALQFAVVGPLMALAQRAPAIR